MSDRDAALLVKLFKQLALSLMPFGVTPRELEHLIRYAFVQAAAETSKLGNGRVNSSRVAARTGLSRSEATRLLRAGIGARAKKVAPVESVVRGWRADRRFRNRNGQPKQLDDTSFTALSRKYAGDIPPRAVLRELQRTGAAVLNGSTVKLKSSRAAALKQSDAKYLSQTLSSLIDAIQRKDSLCERAKKIAERL